VGEEIVERQAKGDDSRSTREHNERSRGRGITHGKEKTGKVTRVQVAEGKGCVHTCRKVLPQNGLRTRPETDECLQEGPAEAKTLKGLLRKSSAS